MIPLDNGITAWHWDAPNPLQIIASDKMPHSEGAIA